MTVLKLLVIGDLHGVKPEIYFKDYDAIIAPGDFCSSSETRNLMFENLKKKLADPKYDKEWYSIVGKTKAKELIMKSLSDGRIILEYLNSLGKPVFTVPGNNDWAPEKKSKWAYLQKDHFKTLIKGLPNIIDIHEKTVNLGLNALIGYGLSSGPEYPQYEEDLKRLKPKELSSMKLKYKKLFTKLSKLFSKEKKPVIFLSHNVPYDTNVDMINNPSSPRNGQHFGSLIARELINKHSPLVCIGGHMHEYFTKCMIINTTVINSGYGPKVNVLLSLDNGKIKNIEFHKEL